MNEHVGYARVSTGEQKMDLQLDALDEDPVNVAARELEEETGWSAGRFEHLASTYPCIGYSNEVIHFYTAHDLERGRQDLAEGEFVETLRMDLSEAIDKARSGALKDMKTVTALLYADAHRRG